jgi:hypothetical protein
MNHILVLALMIVIPANHSKFSTFPRRQSIFPQMSPKVCRFSIVHLFKCELPVGAIPPNFSVFTLPRALMTLPKLRLLSIKCKHGVVDAPTFPGLAQPKPFEAA